MEKRKNRDELFERFRDVCSKAGIKLTHQRLEIYKELTSTREHPSAEALYKRLKKRMPAISLDTVYRNLSLLSDYGIVRRLETAECQARFDGNTSRHYHAVCSKCKGIADFNWEGFNKLIPPNLSAWGKPKDVNVVVSGICSKCLKK